MYIYESHLDGGLYTSEKYMSWEELYCETCDDSDKLIGYASDRSEAWDLLKDDVDTDGSGGWDKEYIEQFLTENWEE